MSGFFHLADFFTGHPERAYLVALVFIALAFVDRRFARFDAATRPWAMFVPAAAWLAYAINEYALRHEDIPVRVDVYLVWPVIVLLTVLFGAVWILNARRVLRSRPWRAPPSPPGSP